MSTYFRSSCTFSGLPISNGNDYDYYADIEIDYEVVMGDSNEDNRAVLDILSVTCIDLEKLTAVNILDQISTNVLSRILIPIAFEDAVKKNFGKDNDSI